MSTTLDSAVQHLHEALALLEKEEAECVAKFDQIMAELRERIASTRLALFPPSSVGGVAIPDTSVTPVRQTQLERSSAYVPPGDLVEKVRGLSQPEALVEIARYYDGVVKTVEVKRVFIKAGLVKPPYKNTANHIWALLNDPERTKRFNVAFVRIDKGVYHLIPYDNDQGMVTNQERLSIDLA